MKKLFDEIRAGDMAAVSARLNAKPDLIRCTAKAPPKKDDGQSPLQVAIKSGGSNAFAVANLLLDRGADVNFQEVSAVNSWTAPVIHDAIRAAAFSSRGGPYGTPRLAAASFDLVSRMLAAGANVNALDSAGNHALARLALDANQAMRPGSDEPLLKHDLLRIAAALTAYGADADSIDARYGRGLREHFADQPASFLFNAVDE